MNKAIEDAVQFFKSDQVYDKLFYAFKKKYESLGRFGGTISLETYTDHEIEIIARFFGMRKDILMEKRKISIIKFEKMLAVYKFGSIDLKLLLEAYFKKPLISKNQKKEKLMQKNTEFFENLKNENLSIIDWISYIEKKPVNSSWIHRLINNSYEVFETYTKILNHSMEAIPDSPIRLPVFAQQMTGTPHGFDRNQNLGRLLIHLLTFKHTEANQETFIMPTSSEEITELLLSYNILRDDITNYITVANILAKSDNRKEELWKIACESRSVLNVPIRELLDIKLLYPDENHTNIWIVENSGVFSSILDEVPDIPLICTHGQFKLSAWKCFDLMVKSGVTLNYASDLDPEGLGMAERLLNRYPNNVSLWKMDTESYAKSLSREEIISEKRLNQLKTLNNPIFDDVKLMMLKYKSPAYQESLIDEMVEELKNIKKNLFN